jgi:dihydroorotase
LQAGALAGATLAAGALPAPLAALLPPGSGSPWHRPQTFDALITGGIVHDPATGLAARRDVGITGGRISAVAESLPTQGTRRILDATGMMVTPGLIDVHVHVFPGVATIGITPDVVGMARGVTTVIDAGSAGATTFPGFRAFVAREARTRVYALLNMSRPGLTLSNELADLDYVNPDLLATTIEGNRDVIVGIKVRMLAGIPGNQDLEVMRRTREAADRTGVPVTLHIGGQHSPLPRILDYLRPGDVITHALRRQGSILDGNGRVYPEVREAMRNGVHLDVGHGMGNLDFDTAERVLDQGVMPDLISSDVHDGNANGPVFDLPTTLSKFLMLGMSMDQVLAAATSTPGRVFPFGVSLGRLEVGAPADISVLQLAEGEYTLVDSSGNRRPATRRLTAFATFRDGLPPGSPGLG